MYAVERQVELRRGGVCIITHTVFNSHAYAVYECVSSASRADGICGRKTSKGIPYYYGPGATPIRACRTFHNIYIGAGHRCNQSALRRDPLDAGYSFVSPGLRFWGMSSRGSPPPLRYRMH